MVYTLVLFLFGILTPCLTLAAPTPFGVLGDWLGNSIPGYSSGGGYYYPKPSTSFNFYDQSSPQYPSYRGSGFKTTRPFYGSGYDTRSYINPSGIGDFRPYNTPSYNVGGIGTEYGLSYPEGSVRGGYGGGFGGSPSYGLGRGSGFYGGRTGGYYPGVPYNGPTYSSRYNP